MLFIAVSPWGGIALPQGTDLFVWLTAANRDPRAFADPDGFDVRRQGAQRALAFGKGPHA